jgi:FtsH-binding integral membrane protein
MTIQVQLGLAVAADRATLLCDAEWRIAVSIPREEAAEALRAAEAAANRSTTAVGYQRASGHLILWGAVWVVANVLAYFRAPYGTYLWPALMLFGVAGSFVLGLRAGRVSGGRSSALTSLLIAAAIFLFSFGVQAVMDVRSFAQAEAIVCLGVGAAYMVLGVSTGLRMSAVGAVVMIAVIAGWVFAREQFFLWLAVAGGGGLILGGLWLRKA